MSRRWHPLLLCLSLAACQSEPQEAASPPLASTAPLSALTDAEKKQITDEIVRNWDLDALKGCPWGGMAPVELLIRLSPSAAVTAIERPVAIDDTACAQAAYQSAEQAARISSPLKIPAGKVVPYVRLRLYPVHVAW